MNNLSDINNFQPIHAIPLAKVGSIHLKEQICIVADEEPYTTIGEFTLSVNLPSNLRAVHMSRSIEALHSVLWNIENGKTYLNKLPIGVICPMVANELLCRHEYAETSDVFLELDYLLSKLSPIRKNVSKEVYEIKLGAHAIRNGVQSKINHLLEVSVTGTSTCPCAQNYLEQIVKDSLNFTDDNISEFWNKIPHPTHMQRTTVNVRLEDSVPLQLSINDLISHVEQEMSSETLELLKRDEEAMIITKALNRPRFVEDIARGVLCSLISDKRLRDSTLVNIKIESEESIHKYNAYVEMAGLIGIIKESMGSANV